MPPTTLTTKNGMKRLLVKVYVIPLFSSRTMLGKTMFSTLEVSIPSFLLTSMRKLRVRTWLSKEDRARPMRGVGRDAMYCWGPGKRSFLPLVMWLPKGA